MSREERRHAEPSSGGGHADLRSAAEHDRDRILYSSAFRRLSDITQIASPTELAPVHNRLTHSLKVAQVAKSLLHHLVADPTQASLVDEAGGIDPYVVEAAALAHDLGHPPFGHTAEAVLAELVPGVGSSNLGFNGNGQSFRILTRLGVRQHNSRERRNLGLNVTRATLAAVLKYPWVQGDPDSKPEKWGAYPSERQDFDWCREGTIRLDDDRSLEAAVMDWADDITYAVHDVEDFFRAGLIPLDRLATDATEFDRFLTWVDRSIAKASVEDVRAAIETSQIMLAPPPGPFEGSRVDRAALRSLTSSVIGRLVSGSISVGYRREGLFTLQIRDEARREVDALQYLARYYVIERPSLMALRYGQRTIVQELFTCFQNAATDHKQRTILPAFFREEVELLGPNPSDEAIKRIVSDLIASLSEHQAIAMHQRLTGRTVGSAMDIHPA